MRAGAYVHVPFCLARCRYCAFYSGEPLDALPRYPGLLEAEMLLSDVPEGPLSTVYFGGGTPSLLPPRAVAQILDALHRTWGLDADPEITLEVNPASSADFRGFAAAGVNRVSIGVQALNDRLLAALGRLHRADDALAALASARRAGLDRLSADLLFGLAGLSADLLGSWARTVAAEGATHVSTYSLEIHPGTGLAKARRRGAFSLASPAEEESQWEAVDNALAAAGLRPYEVSNYAAAGYACRHNVACWDGASYRGLGPGAHSFDARVGSWGARAWNHPGLDGYERNLTAGQSPAGGGETLSAAEAFLERLFLSLRRPAALDLGSLCREHGMAEGPVLVRARAAAAQGLLRPAGSSWLPTRTGLRAADGLAVSLAATAHPAPRSGPSPEAPLGLTAKDAVATVRP